MIGANFDFFVVVIEEMSGLYMRGFLKYDFGVVENLEPVLAAKILLQSPDAHPFWPRTL